MKRFLSVLLALVMVLSCASAAMADEEWVTVRLEVFDRSTAGLDLENGWQHKYIQENFGDPNHIKVEFVPIPRWTETEVLNRQLSGQTAPDICYTYDSGLVQQYIDWEGLLPLDDLLAEYGQNLVKFLGEDVLKFGRRTIDGVEQQMTLCARRISVARSGAFVRGDWLEALNMANPTTVEEWIAYLRAAKAANLGGQQTVPFNLKTVPESPTFSFDLLIDAMIDWDKVTKDMYYSQYKIQLPGAKEAFRIMNTLYNEGLLNETFAIDNGDIRDLAMNQGYAGCYIESATQVWGVNGGYQYEMAQNVPGAYWVPTNCFQDKFGRTLHESYDANGMNIFIPAWVDEKTAIAAIKLLDWMSIKENRINIAFGTEGINYEYTSEEGFPMNRLGNAVADEYKLSGDVLCISNGTSFDDAELDAKYQAISFPGYEELVTESLQMVAIDAYTPVTFSVAIQADADYGLTVKSKISELMAHSFTCAPEEFDATFDAGLAEVLAVGGEEVVAEKLAAYQAGEFRGAYPGLAE